jgi:hypothetical protein
MRKINCWEFMKCGCELGGRKSKEFGVCSAAMEARLDGAHGGRSGGRSCWIIPNTLCYGKQQGLFSEKHPTCEKCGFFWTVKREEGLRLILAPVLLNVLQKVPRILRASPEEHEAA